MYCFIIICNLYYQFCMVHITFFSDGLAVSFGPEEHELHFEVWKLAQWNDMHDFRDVILLFA